ncbi:MAG: FAD-dependent oxidoreductase [Gemmataceae bacterium]|nr:FAD-dependent oxidoreductase [Gemmataceae bacterium]MCI0741037.1 FAD-dependent oxidoreductase [Gemmataceae bacterium]
MIAKATKPTLVVVGTGMAGAKVVEEILARAPERFHVRMFGAEPLGTYNRSLLSSVLAGQADPTRLWLNPLDWYKDRNVFVHSGVRVESIDPEKRVVVGAGGKVSEPYDYLILATGSRPFVPPIDGMRQQGVFLFRTLEDCAAIGAYAQECDRAVVLGGGLLGLEAARGLLNHGLEVTVVETAPRLMAQHLDAAAADILRRKLDKIGLDFRLATQTTALLGEGKVQGLRFEDGSTLEADMVVVSCGIRPNVDEAKAAGLLVKKGIVVDDQLCTSDPDVYAVGECAEHRGVLYGLVDPVHEQARVLADVLCESNPNAAYAGSRLAATLKVTDVELTSMGEVHADGGDYEIVSHQDPGQHVYKKLVVKEQRLVGAILLGAPDPGDRLKRLFQEAALLSGSPFDLLFAKPEEHIDVVAAPGDDAQSRIRNAALAAKNKIELMKKEKDGLDSLEDILPLASRNAWEEMTEDDKQRAKWHGLFFRKPTPGNFMLRLRLNAGQTNARQLRVIADISDEYGRGFCDITTRQQIQLRWFTLGDVPEIWRRLEEVGLFSKQTGMDNVRGVCGCPVAGLTPHELLDATPVIEEFNRIILGNKEFTNLPRKFNVTISGCLENCCHSETQDIALVPAYRELEGAQVNGFNVLVGGKQGSGGYRPASPLDVFVRPEEAARLCADITRVYRDHGPRAQRNRARLSFLLDERGIGWFRREVEKTWGEPLVPSGTDVRKVNHVDHLGFHPQKKNVETGRTPHYVGFLVPVGRITTRELRGVADLAERYGDGTVRVTVGQNLVIANVPEERIGALADEPLLRDLPYAPSPIMRGLVACTGTDYCGMALIETKGYAMAVARELERRTAGQKVLPLSIHWSGCPASCGLHQVATIGLQGCRSRVDGVIVDAAHVCIGGKTGPSPVVATDLMYDVPLSQLADALEPLIRFLPRQ